MSTKNVRLFFEEAKKDDRLWKQLYQLLDSSDEEFINEIIKIGRENGYEFTCEDVKSFGKAMAIMAESSFISEDVNYVVFDGAHGEKQRIIAG